MIFRPFNGSCIRWWNNIRLKGCPNHDLPSVQFLALPILFGSGLHESVWHSGVPNLWNLWFSVFASHWVSLLVWWKIRERTLPKIFTYLQPSICFCNCSWNNIMSVEMSSFRICAFPICFKLACMRPSGILQSPEPPKNKNTMKHEFGSKLEWDQSLFCG